MPNPDDGADLRRDQEGSPEVLEGGEVTSFEETPITVEKHRAETARYLAYVLVGILAITIFCHYGLTAWFVQSGREESIAYLDKTFNVVIPLLSGLVGGATTYFFTKGRR